MALTQVRVKVEGEWVTLTYNSATGRYEAQYTFGSTSIHQPGGYYNIEAEAANSTGQTDSVSGTILPALRQVVRETAAPTLELVSPPAGWLTTANPTFIFRAQDEAGGSGIDTSSAKATIDGVSVPCTVTTDGAGYQISVSGQTLSEGPHTVTAAISDRDGNQTTASAAYQVDTIPPESLWLWLERRSRGAEDATLWTFPWQWERTTSPSLPGTLPGTPRPRRFT